MFSVFQCLQQFRQSGLKRQGFIWQIPQWNLWLRLCGTHEKNAAETINKLISCKCRALISCLSGLLFIRKDLIIQKGEEGGGERPCGHLEGRPLVVAVDIVLTDSLKGGSSVSRCQAWLFFRGVGGSGEEGVGGCGIRGLPRYLCVKGHTGLAEEAKATTICVFHMHTHTHTLVHLSGPGSTYTLAHKHITSFTPICVHADCMMKDALSKMRESPHMCL